MDTVIRAPYMQSIVARFTSLFIPVSVTKIHEINAQPSIVSDFQKRDKIQDD